MDRSEASVRITQDKPHSRPSLISKIASNRHKIDLDILGRLNKQTPRGFTQLGKFESK